MIAFTFSHPTNATLRAHSVSTNTKGEIWEIQSKLEYDSQIVSKDQAIVAIKIKDMFIN